MKDELFIRWTALGVAAITCGIMAWYFIKEERRATERHNFNRKMNQMVYDKMVLTDMEQNFE